MANTFTAPFAQTTQTGDAVATAASVITTSSPTNSILIATAGANGGLLTGLSAVPRATVTAMGLYVFVSNDSGSTKMLLESVLMAAHTVATTTAIPKTEFSFSETTPVRLAAGDEVYVSAGVALASGVVFTAQWSDF